MVAFLQIIDPNEKKNEEKKKDERFEISKTKIGIQLKLLNHKENPNHRIEHCSNFVPHGPTYRQLRQRTGYRTSIYTTHCGVLEYLSPIRLRLVRLQIGKYSLLMQSLGWWCLDLC
ncbi:uncharacterized protein LOC131327504 [Rhododendron vialii]|uniref:uncharacterized protein LOC131327504 n=1 Tax=Rhododendron vialii TaxID=182163 RepID=UPI00265ED8DF|nr:uncharacterized protein LOC131327504 [Rhododendron vialii]